MAWEAAYPFLDAVLGAGDAAITYGPRLAPLAGVTYAAYNPQGAKRKIDKLTRFSKKAGSSAIREWTHPFSPRSGSKRQRVSGVLNNNEEPKAGKMSLLTYRRQTFSRRGRSRRTVRRLARASKRKRLDGSSSSLIGQALTLTFPKNQTGSTLGDGDCVRTIFVPSLGPLLNEIDRVYLKSNGTGDQSGQFFAQILKTRYELSFTPNWPDHAVSAIGITVELGFYRLRHRTELESVVNVPKYTEQAQAMGHLNCMPKQQSTTGYAVGTTFKEYLDGLVQRYDKDNADSKDPTVTQGNKNRYIQSMYSWLDSPNFNALWEFKQSKTFYIPYGQSMQYSFVVPGQSISYRDLEIPYDYPASPASDLDLHQYLPRGWPMMAFKLTKHIGDEAISSTGIAADDAMLMNVRQFWRCPDYYGRSLRHYDTTTLAYPNELANTAWENPFDNDV